LTYEEFDCWDYPWLCSPANLPMYGEDVLAELAGTNSQNYNYYSV
jgi:hypothetical protein